MHFDTSQRMCALLGMTLTVWLQVQQEELVKTIVLAGLGGAASYLGTVLIKFLVYCYRKRR